MIHLKVILIILISVAFIFVPPIFLQNVDVVHKIIIYIEGEDVYTPYSVVLMSWIASILCVTLVIAIYVGVYYLISNTDEEKEQKKAKKQMRYLMRHLSNPKGCGNFALLLDKRPQWRATLQNARYREIFYKMAKKGEHPLNIIRYIETTSEIEDKKEKS